jgi:hypothetical protein
LVLETNEECKRHAAPVSRARIPSDAEASILWIAVQGLDKRKHALGQGLTLAAMKHVDGEPGPAEICQGRLLAARDGDPVANGRREDPITRHAEVIPVDDVPRVSRAVLRRQSLSSAFP